MRLLFALCIAFLFGIVSTMADCGACCTNGICNAAFRGGEGICCGVRSIDAAFSRPFCCPSNSRCIEEDNVFKCQILSTTPTGAAATPTGTATTGTAAPPAGTVTVGPAGTAGTVGTAGTTAGTATYPGTVTATGAEAHPAESHREATTAGANLGTAGAVGAAAVANTLFRPRTIPRTTGASGSVTSTDSHGHAVTTTPVRFAPGAHIDTHPHPLVPSAAVVHKEHRKSGWTWWKILLLAVGCTIAAALLAWGLYRLVRYCRTPETRKIIIPHNHGRRVVEDVRL